MDAEVRVWRLRKDHKWIDARLRPCADSSDVEVQFFYDGALLFARRCASRELALTQADEQLRHLQRAGWNAHW